MSEATQSVLAYRVAPDPIPAIERAVAVAVSLYDGATEDERVRSQALLILAHLRNARKIAG
jgi:hypothetical protein